MSDIAKTALELLAIDDVARDGGTSDEEKALEICRIFQKGDRSKWICDQYRELLKEDEKLPGPQDYKDALTVQDACNISGVVFSFARVMDRINNQMHALKESSDWRTVHPIVRLFAEQIAHLGHVADTAAYRHAYEACKHLSQLPEKED